MTVRGIYASEAAGRLILSENATASDASVDLQGNGTMILSGGEDDRFEVGTLSGSGTVVLNGHTLAFGASKSRDIYPSIYGGMITDGLAPGSLEVGGNATVTLDGTNTYSGWTFVRQQGRLHVDSPRALGSSTVVVDGGELTFASRELPENLILLRGGTFERDVEAMVWHYRALSISALDAAGHTVTQTAEVLDVVSRENARWRARFVSTSSARNDALRRGDVFELEDMAVIDWATGETDVFVLQIHLAGVTQESFLAWYDELTDSWVNAVEGNFGGTSTFVGDIAYDPARHRVLGTHGVDTEGGFVWAVLNHNSSFAIVPEPSSSALVILAVLGLLHRFRRRA